jgi:hypothetical protein
MGEADDLPVSCLMLGACTGIRKRWSKDPSAGTERMVIVPRRLDLYHLRLSLSRA